MTVGRPIAVTPEILLKLEHAFAIGCSDLEACFFADISKTALYNYQDANPDLKDRKDQLKQNPVLKARLVVMADIIAGDVDSSKWLLERKKKDEFSLKVETKSEHSGSISFSGLLDELTGSGILPKA